MMSNKKSKEILKFIHLIMFNIFQVGQVCRIMFEDDKFDKYFNWIRLVILIFWLRFYDWKNIYNLPFFSSSRAFILGANFVFLSNKK